MLVLTRRLDEVIVIGPDITVTVLGVRGDAVRLGIQAPNDVVIHRLEVADRIAREQREARGESRS